MNGLWHFTCSHGRRGIGRVGIVRPNRHAFLHGPPLAWFTDHPDPDRMSVGLTSETLTCDRMAYRYRVTDPADVEPFAAWSARNPQPLDVWSALTSHGDPARWFVSVVPVPVRLDMPR